MNDLHEAQVLAADLAWETSGDAHKIAKKLLAILKRANAA